MAAKKFKASANGLWLRSPGAAEAKSGVWAQTCIHDSRWLETITVNYDCDPRFKWTCQMFDTVTGASITLSGPDNTYKANLALAKEQLGCPQTAAIAAA